MKKAKDTDVRDMVDEIVQELGLPNSDQRFTCVVVIVFSSIVSENVYLRWDISTRSFSLTLSPAQRCHNLIKVHLSHQLPT